MTKDDPVQELAGALMACCACLQAYMNQETDPVIRAATASIYERAIAALRAART